MKNKILTIILILLAIHLLYTNSILLMNFVEEKNIINDAMRIVFAASYSIITVLIIKVYPVRYVFVISGILDGFSVAIKYLPINDELLFILSAIYFGLYTMFIVIIAGEINKKNEAKTKQDEKRQTANEEKTRIDNINKLRSEKRSLQNGLNSLKNETKRKNNQAQIIKINQELLNLTNKKLEL